MKQSRFEPRFLDVVPSDIEVGILYMSIKYRTAVHLCACGCGNAVVTPIRPAKWHLTFDGDTVSLSPSTGNWQFPCRSHYWIDQNQVDWAAAWTEKQITLGREKDQADVDHYYSVRRAKRVPATPVEPAKGPTRYRRALRRLINLLRRGRTTVDQTPSNPERR